MRGEAHEIGDDDYGFIQKAITPNFSNTMKQKGNESSLIDTEEVRLDFQKSDHT